MSDYVGGTRVDRSFLYLMSIYAIHGILLHVFLRPMNVNGIDIDNNLIHKVNYDNSGGGGGSDDWEKFFDNKNLTSIESNNGTPAKNFNQVKVSIINQPTYQGISSGASLNFLPPAKSSSGAVSQLTTKTCAFLMSVMKNISPSAWGILSGCIVFLLTFPENDNVR